MNQAYPYAVLGFDRENVTDEQVRHAYIEQVRRYPPERHPDRFQAIHTAYDQINTEQKRLLRRFQAPVPDWKDILSAMPQEDILPAIPRRIVAKDLLTLRATELLRVEN